MKRIMGKTTDDKKAFLAVLRQKVEEAQEELEQALSKSDVSMKLTAYKNWVHAILKYRQKYQKLKHSWPGSEIITIVKEAYHNSVLIWGTAKFLIEPPEPDWSSNSRPHTELDKLYKWAIKAKEESSKTGDEIKQTSEINKAKGGLLMATAEASKENWEKIKSEYDCGKTELAKKINFVKDAFKRKIILRDVEHAFVLASHGFAKPAVILAGGVIEELLKEFLEYKKVKPKSDRFIDYIKACEDNRLLKRGVSRLSDAIRDFRNLVHISGEKSKRHTITMATAKGAVSSIFSIANDFH
jgi:hypothetical protein